MVSTKGIPFPPNTSAFTTRIQGRALRLINQAIVVAGGASFQVVAQWDTGATMTCISSQVIEALQLVPTGRADIRTPSGQEEVSSFLIDLLFIYSLK